MNIDNGPREFVASEHLSNLLAGPWAPMLNGNGKPLEGIRGRVGVAAESFSGRKIGLDLMEIVPGHGFPVHFHEGDHILYTLSGEGSVEIDEKVIVIREGDAMFIPAERTHRVTVPADCRAPLVMLAFGFPHKGLSTVDRMK